ncbi:MAG: hypothetical protein ACOYL5_13860 [Phototrophicaceae bacterium]|jgi:hypothetical protein
MPKREQLVSDLTGEHKVGVLLVAQMGGAPEEIQIIVQTATYDESIQGLREGRAYVIRALGVKEHRITLGLFNNLFFAQEHPILHHHNLPRYAIQFDGQAKDINELVLDIQAAYSATFGPWRDLAEDVNRTMPLFTLFQQGEGMLGTMPDPAAQRMVKVLEHHGLAARLEQALDGRTDKPDDRGRVNKLHLLGIDDSYLIAYSFSVDEMGQLKK